MSSLAAWTRCFFKSLLEFLVRTGDDGPGLPQPELQLMEQPLALAHSKDHLLSLRTMMGQKFPAQRFYVYPNPGEISAGHDRCLSPALTC